MSVTKHTTYQCDFCETEVGKRDIIRFNVSWLDSGKTVFSKSKFDMCKKCFKQIQRDIKNSNRVNKSINTVDNQ